MIDSAAAIQSVAMLAVFALTWGGVVLVRHRQDRTRGILMIVAAAVLLVNVLIWAVPVRSGG